MQLFGEYHYGTEIIELPTPGNNYGNSPALPIFENEHLPDEETLTVSTDTQFWFRWITGHQVILGLWNILGNELSHNVPSSDEQSLNRCIQMFKASSVIFNYTGSCPHDFYHEKIRIFMSLFHGGFSGMWAADYRHIPRLIQKITRATTQPEMQAIQQELKKAYEDSHLTHIEVAKRLVPEGESLLKKAKKEGLKHKKIKKTHSMIYDCFFLIHRNSISKEVLIESLDRRVEAIVTDLEKTPFLPPLNNSDAIKTLQETMAMIKKGIATKL